MALTSKERVMKQALGRFAGEYIKLLTKNLKQLRKVASGDLVKSLGYTLKKTGMGTNFTIVIESLEYLKYVDKGRRPGTFPNITSLQRWARIKNIPKRAVFPIAKKIKEQGIKPTNVVPDTLQDLLYHKPFNQFEKEMEDWLGAVVDEMIETSGIKLSGNNNITIK